MEFFCLVGIFGFCQKKFLRLGMFSTVSSRPFAAVGIARVVGSLACSLHVSLVYVCGGWVLRCNLRAFHVSGKRIMLVS